MTRRRPSRAPRAVMSDAQFRAITLELVRLCLGGQPDRPELEYVEVLQARNGGRR